MKKRKKRGDRYIYILFSLFIIFAISVSNANPLRSIIFEPARAGTDMPVIIKIVNEFGFELEDLRLRIMGLDVDTFDARGGFDIDGKQSKNKFLYLPIPSTTQPGEYMVRVVLTNEDIRKVRHRYITVI